MIRRAKRVADYLQAECMAVAIQARKEESDAVERHLSFARNLHIDARLLDADTVGDDPAQALVEFAHLNGVTQLFLAQPQRTAILGIPRASLEQRIVWLSRDMQVTIVADRTRISS